MSKSLNWYPGHMAKAVRRLEKELPAVDALIEICDARIPLSSHNPMLDALRGQKYCLRVLGRADLADAEVTARWKRAIPHSVALDATRPGAAKQLLPALRVLLGDLLEQRSDKGQSGRPLHLMVAGIPNCGKSTLINNLLGRRAARAEDRPGVTRGGQWYALENGWQLYDTPGLLWPKLEDQNVATHLAYTGAMPDEIMDIETLAARLLVELCKRKPNAVKERYKIDITNGDPQSAGDEAAVDAFGYVLLERLAFSRSYLITRGEADLERAAATLLDEFRAGKIGRISLEEPDAFLADALTGS